MALASFLLIWTATWGILYALLLPGKGLLDKGWVLAILFAIIVAHSAHWFLHLNKHGWESNRLLSIGIGGGIGWMMLLNVWGVIWRIQKRSSPGPKPTPKPAPPFRQNRSAWRDGLPGLAHTRSCPSPCSSSWPPPATTRCLARRQALAKKKKGGRDCSSSEVRLFSRRLELQLRSDAGSCGTARSLLRNCVRRVRAAVTPRPLKYRADP